ncbi:MAG: hypothetical protein C4548_16075 [Desulfobacteraceae bacterium]|jgi:hypothetical protein|nr:MAG: hypothetical protein C4548_16075 [Desulfobacteraceae bacterium]
MKTNAVKQRKKMPGVVQLDSQRGSITVMIAFLLPIMLLMLVLVVNINHMIFQKIRLQNIVDACALSAAAVQAAGLNEIADLNRDLMTESQKIERILAGGVWHNYSHARDAKNFFSNGSSGVLDWIYKYQMEANQYYAAQADNAARHVKDKNLAQAFLRARHNTSELAGFKTEKYSYFFLYYLATDTSKAPPRPTRRWRNPDNPRYAGDHDGVYYMPGKRRLPKPDFFEIPYRLEKQATTIADYDIVLPAHDFPLGNLFFGGVPALHAKAAAKPAGGYIAQGIPNYRALLVN